MKKIFFTYFIFVLATLSGCNGDDAPTTAEILTVSEWTSLTNLEDIDADGTFVEFGDDCEKDDHSIFKTSGKYQNTNGTNVCDPDTAPNAVIAEADWELTNNDQELVLKFFADDIRFTIINISDHELELGVIDNNDPQGVITQKVVLRR